MRIDFRVIREGRDGPVVVVLVLGGVSMDRSLRDLLLSHSRLGTTRLTDGALGSGNRLRARGASAALAGSVASALALAGSPSSLALVGLAAGALVTALVAAVTASPLLRSVAPSVVSPVSATAPGGASGVGARSGSASVS